ncbi:MAG: single-stranded DNA-binding protein [Eubacteriales bacterium]
MNDYTVIGNLTKEPTFNENGDTKFCNFTIAVNNRGSDPSYVNVVAYNNQAQACMDYLKKGSQVCVKGTPEADAWIGKDGEAHASLKVKSKEVEFLSRTKEKNKEMSNIDKAMQNTHQNSPANSANNHNQQAR